MLNTQYDYKKSYMYVIDQHNRIIFHPDKNRIGEKIINNTGLDYINKNIKGSIRLKNSLGIDNLARFCTYSKCKLDCGFSATDSMIYLPKRRPLISKYPLESSFSTFSIFLLIWYISKFISSPSEPLGTYGKYAQSCGH